MASSRSEGETRPGEGKIAKPALATRSIRARYDANICGPPRQLGKGARDLLASG